MGGGEGGGGGGGGLGTEAVRTTMAKTHWSQIEVQRIKNKKQKK